jgi:formylmethanofuran dehydrogenase subunit E
MYCPDNYDAFCEHEASQESLLEKLPKCADCGEPIQEEHLFDINGDLFCYECAKSNFKRDTENYMRG